MYNAINKKDSYYYYNITANIINQNNNKLYNHLISIKIENLKKSEKF